jgi:hypothetical protein
MLKRLSVVIALITSLVGGADLAFARGRGGGGRPYYGGGSHSGSHGGTYRGGSGSSHRGGTYSNPRTGDQYGRHK